MIKKTTYILVLLLIASSTGVFAQGQMDALRFSREGIFGTARSTAMGGAFGALGGDQTGVSINPAGIGVYRSSEVVGTFGFTRETSTVGNHSAHRNLFNMDNLGFVGFLPLRSNAMPFINFGFSYNRAQSFNRRTSAFGSPRNSLLDYIADRSFGIDPFDLEFRNNHDPFMSGQPWLSVLAYNNWLINPGDDGHWTPVNTTDRPTNEIQMRESGYIDNFNLTVGTAINNVLNIGASISVKEVRYRLYSEYFEDFQNGWFGLHNTLTTDGAGVGAKFGIIYRPIQELRIGVAYHTPTWFSLRETFSAAMEDEMHHYVTDPDRGEGWHETESALFSSDYNLRTPGRWVFSLAAVLGNNFIASLDYELVDFRSARLSPPTGIRNDFEEDNELIAADFGLASTIRFGMEYRINHQLSVRAGYAWMQNPHNAAFRNGGDPAIAGSNAIFRMEGNTNFFTAGLGYRFNRNFFLDLALVYRVQTDELFPFPNLWEWDRAGENRQRLVVDATPFELRSTAFRGVVTLGYRF
jgi:hypothetical protein